ncbi:G5P family DNA-binding protein [Dechloromonas sp. XY25]|uniref:Single-stranded DNA-binding protein n=1 Tax=Dechloromonas hankyongensis TaxID=2908002 RepID=A0ABS9K366_9RHOO|nr:single-stranded DNA-binding protein [Dechloromonas hankyongensis]MCG2577586.1 G5P family DNA-binding protein [Dechloromonas hankyongensis]
MLKVSVETEVIDLKTGISAKTGKPYNIREQEAWMYGYGRDGQPQKHPQKIKLTLDDEQEKGYPVGQYILDPASIYVDRFGQVAIRARLRVPAAAVPAQPKAA